MRSPTTGFLQAGDPVMLVALDSSGLKTSVRNVDGVTLDLRLKA
jgi:hypothetical protein